MEPNCEQVEQGKIEWPELIHVKGETARAIIKRENPLVKAEIILEGTMILGVYICNRVLVWVDDYGITTQVPTIG